MKKLILLSLALVATLTASAQYYADGRPIPPRHRYSGSYNRSTSDTYYGFHVGMAVASVHSDAAILDGSSPRVGLDVGFDIGTRLAPSAPLYFESGLSYVEKGGKGDYQGNKFTYNLGYLELPLQLKYKYFAQGDLSIEPFIGGYLALGVGGKIKDYGEREAYSSFGNGEASFKRFDGGLRLGCGLTYNVVHLSLSYDIGLANVGHYDFEDTRTGSLNLNVGVRF